MKIGLVARADDRGLGVMTHEFSRNLPVERVLVVREPGAEAKGFDPHLDRYPDATVVTFTGGQLPEDDVRGWLTGLDVVYGAETWYDPRLPGWARDARCATVLHAMPEFYRPDMASTVVWAPTSWRLDLLPAGAPVVPVPVEPHPVARGHTHEFSRLRVVHVVGRRAAGDRNGTLILAAALSRMRDTDVVIWCQDRRLPAIRAPRGIGLDVRLGGTSDRWAMYEGGDVAVLPRRYGGLCLPAQEALAAGLGLVMTDCPPNPDWPILAVAATPGRLLATPGGPVDTWNADPRALALALNKIADRPELLAAMRGAAASWAARHTWPALTPIYLAGLAEAADQA